MNRSDASELRSEHPGRAQRGDEMFPAAVAKFEPIGRETLTARIGDALFERISSGELQPGARLPSERELSEQFRVARTSVREAVQGLVSLGFVERRRNRSYVAERLPDIRVDVRDDTKAFVRDLFETRRALEHAIIELAATRASDDDRSRILQLAKQFRPSMPLAEFRRLDRQFHAAIARATGNPLLIEMYGKVLARLFDSAEFDDVLGAERNRESVALIIEESTEQHAVIASAIADGDTSAAVREGVGHLHAVELRIVDRLRYDR